MSSKPIPGGSGPSEDGLDADTVHVIFVSGYRRSGSTVLDYLLHRSGACATPGELGWLWGPALQGRTLCTCGDILTECKHWREILDRAFREEWREPRFQEQMLRTGAALRAGVKDPRTLLDALARHSEWIQTFAGRLANLYRSIAFQAGRKVVVDSTKTGTFPFLLPVMEGIEHTVVHLVRDPRGVAHSWQTPKKLVEFHENDVSFPRLGPARVARNWVAHNLMTELTRSRLSSGPRIRYEDLVSEPDATIDRILSVAASNDAADLAGNATSEVHRVGGNPWSFEDDTLELELDERWKQEMSTRDLRIVEGVTWPLRLRYGYT